MRFFLFVLLALTSGAALAEPSLATPATAVAGGTITFKAVGTGNPREFVTVVPRARAKAVQGLRVRDAREI